MITTNDHQRAAEFKSRMRMHYDTVVHPWRRKQSTLQPVDDEIRFFVQAMLELIGIPHAEEFLTVFADEVQHGAALTPMRKLERLAAYLILKCVPTHTARSRLHAARSVMLNSLNSATHQSSEISAMGLALLSAPHTRRTLLAAAVVPWMQNIKGLPPSDPLELSASEKASFRTALNGLCSTNKGNRNEPDCPGKYLEIFLDQYFCASQKPEFYHGFELPCGLGLPHDSLNQLTSALMAGELPRSRIAAFYCEANRNFYGPDWTQLHSGEKHRAMLCNTAMCWGMREIPPFLIGFCNEANLQDAAKLPPCQQPRRKLEGWKMRLFEFFEEILIVTWDLEPPIASRMLLN